MLCHGCVWITNRFFLTSVLSAIHGPYVISDESYRQIGLVHNAMVGHGGVERTLQKLKNLNLIWKNMRLDVKTYLRECPCCQKMSQIKIPINAYKYITSTYRPMECLNIDFIGPYPDKGYVLNKVDTFTRWVELYYGWRSVQMFTNTFRTIW